MTRPIATALALLALIISPAPLAAADHRDVLVTVNGEAITAADMDAMLIEAHKGRGAAEIDARFLGNLLEKSINDRLLLQQALAIGLDEDPALLGELAEIRERAAVSRLIREEFRPEIEVDPGRVRGEWESYYWRVQLRQVSVRTRDRAERIRAAVVAGADMDSLARAVSLDTRKYRGGLHNLKIWGDVEGELRGPARDLEPGEVSEVFPYREAFAVVRMEQRLPPDEAEFPGREPGIRKYLAEQDRKAAWSRFVAERAEACSLRADREVLDRVRGDGASVQDGTFMRPSDAVAFSAAGTRPVTEGELRRLVSKSVMDAPGAPFDSLYVLGETRAREQIVMRAAAAAGGYADLPGVAKLVAAEKRQKLIQNYLQEMVAAKIRFNREEFAEYHRSHPEEFAGPAEVLLDVMVISDREKAENASRRLQAGADIDFVREQAGAGDSGSPKWSPETVFSPAIRRQLAQLEVGEAGDPVELPSGWMVFKFLGRKPGELRPIEECEMTIRERIFENKFNELLDEHLGLLKERSEIVRNDANIERYFAGGD